MTAVMEAKKIRLVLMTSEATRRALRVQAAQLDLDMSALAQAVLDYALPLVGKKNCPPDLAAAIEKAKKDAQQ